MALRSFSALLLALLLVPAAAAQSLPPPAAAEGGGLGLMEPAPQYEILGISVEGVGDERTASFVQQQSGLTVGQNVAIPGDPAFAEAIRSIYKLGTYSDVKIAVERRVGDGAFLVIEVQPEPRLADYTFEGVRKGHRDDLRKKLPLIRNTTVRPADLERSKQVIGEYYKEKGFLLADVDVEQVPKPEAGTVDLVFRVDPGPRVEVGDIVVQGNEEISERRIRRKMKETKESRWWRFWRRDTFDENKFEEDLQSVVDYYREKGYYDARVVQDTVYLEQEGSKPEVIVELAVHEGPRYHIRNIEWEGNTVYPDRVLTESLGFERGDVYNAKKLEQNLYANRQSTDVASLYMNRGHMRFQAEPMVRVVEGDSLDLVFDVYEGDVYTFGDIEITGNTKTKEHVIRRELYTIPGQTFSRESIQESIRRLAQLNYFNQEAMAGGPGININEEAKTVDLAYKLEEVGSDQLELSGTWGRFGLILMLRFGFNNFSAQKLFDRSAWRPLPSGDGQKLSLALQTNGTYYQSYSLSFTEPWFRGRPTPIGFALSHSRVSRLPSYYGFGDTGGGGFVTSSARFFYERRLKWPDDYFNSSSSVGYQYFLNRDGFYRWLPSGVSQSVTLQQSFSRNSLDNPMFPMRGSLASFSVEVAPPVPGFIQYHKWRFRTSWNVPIVPKVSLGVSTDFGYLGSLTGDRVEFERFDVGGSPFETQGGYYDYGTDIIYMRGYPRSAIGPRSIVTGDIVGGTVLNKYTSELRWLAIQSPQLSAAPYLFLDAANTWDGLGNFNPAELYRSAGVGMRLFLPIIGMLELTYGYNFDTFDPVAGRRGNHLGDQRWYFQFSLGQGFGQ